MTLAKLVLALALMLPAALAQAPAGPSLLDEARAAAALEPTGESVRIPMPNDADEGRFAVLIGDVDPRNATFAWSRETFLDAWARELEGYRVSFDNLGGGARCSAEVTGVASTTTPLDRYLRYLPGDDRPAVHGGELRMCGAGVIVTTDGVFGGVSIERINYVAWASFTCLFRNDLQGRDVEAGTDVAGACGAIDAGATWHAGKVEVRDGFRKLPLYIVIEDERSTYVARLTLAEGIAYPVELATARLEAGESRSGMYRLDALQLGGEPLPDGPLVDEPAPLPTMPLDPLLGPDDADARLPLRLRDAARAAVADPTLSDLQALLAKPDAVLAGAVLRGDAGASTPSAAPAWQLAFTAPGEVPVLVRCTGHTSPVPLPTDPPIARCANDMFLDIDLGEPPAGFGAKELPNGAITFRDALARLEERDPAAAQRSITFALYRAWNEPHENEVPAVGMGAQFTDPTGTSAEAAEASIVSTISLATGRSVYDFRAAEDPVLVSALPAGISAGGIETGAAPAPGRAANAPALIGAGVATVGVVALIVVFWAALKGSFAALFTRLVRPKVLDAELRASIHELVLSRPGIHASEIIQHFDRGTGAIEYHLDVLVREGFLTSLKTSGYRHYFVTGRFSPGEMRAIAALRAGQGERLYRIIEANPGIHVQALAEQAGLSVGYVSKEIKRMNEAGLVDQVKVGRAVRLHALDR